MNYEFRGKSLASVVARAVGQQQLARLSSKGSDSNSASVWSGRNARLFIEVRRGERYRVEWVARRRSDESYSIRIFTNVGLGEHEEVFSESGSWDFSTGNYEGEVMIVVEFFYAFSALRVLDVSVS